MPRRPRLLVVGPLPPPVGGVETVTQAVLESPAFADFDVTHCSTTKGPTKEKVGRFDADNILWALRHFSRMSAAMTRSRPDVVYLAVSGTWSGFLRDAVLAGIARRGGARVVGHIHGSNFHEILERHGLAERIVRTGLDQFDSLLVLGEHWRGLIEAYGVRARYAVAPSTFRREVLERGLAWTPPERGDREVVGLLAGSLGRRKGVFDLLDALAACKAAGLRFRMVFVGPEEHVGDWDALLRRRRELGLEDLAEFTGPLQGEPLYDRFRASDLYVMPSYTEGLPVAFFEAGAFGLPVITTPVGSITDLIRHGENGLLVQPGHIDELVEAIGRLARDPAERRRLGARLRQDVMEFHPDRVCARIAAEVRAVLAPAEKRS